MSGHGVQVGWVAWVADEWQLTFQPFLVNLVAFELYVAFVVAVGVATVLVLVLGRSREGERPTKVAGTAHSRGWRVW